jgi:hypothetical protein
MVNALLDVLFSIAKVKKVVSFTPKFVNMLKCKSLGRANTIYNRDGADCKQVKVREYKLLKMSCIHLFFYMQQPWAGLERLIVSIKARPYIPCQLYITG